jgi:hypothetical protein
MKWSGVAINAGPHARHQRSETTHTLSQGSAHSSLFYLRTSSLWVSSPSGIRKRRGGYSDSIRSMGLREGPRVEFREENRKTVGGEDVARAGIVSINASEHLPAASLLEVSECRPFGVGSLRLSSPPELFKLRVGNIRPEQTHLLPEQKGKSADTTELQFGLP